MLIFKSQCYIPVTLYFYRLLDGEIWTQAAGSLVHHATTKPISLPLEFQVARSLSVLASLDFKFKPLFWNSGNGQRKIISPMMVIQALYICRSKPTRTTLLFCPQAPVYFKLYYDIRCWHISLKNLNSLPCFSLITIRLF